MSELQIERVKQIAKYIDEFFIKELTNIIISFVNCFEVGDICDCLDNNGRFYLAKIINESNNQFKIHFFGWADDTDEWIDKFSQKIQSPYTFTQEQIISCKIGQSVHVKGPNFKGQGIITKVDDFSVNIRLNFDFIPEITVFKSKFFIREFYTEYMGEIELYKYEECHLKFLKVSDIMELVKTKQIKWIDACSEIISKKITT